MCLLLDFYLAGENCKSNTAVKSSNFTNTNDYSTGYLDMLKDDIVSEHLTRYCNLHIY